MIAYRLAAAPDEGEREERTGGAEVCDGRGGEQGRGSRMITTSFRTAITDYGPVPKRQMPVLQQGKTAFHGGLVKTLFPYQYLEFDFAFAQVE